eukprot:g2321.t1
MPMACFVRIDPPSQGGRMDDLTISKDYKSVTLTSKSEEKRTKVMAVIDAESKALSTELNNLKAQAQATHLLADALGGNSSTCVIGFCRQGQTNDSAETLDLIDLFLRARTYPLHNADIEQGFSRKMRMRIAKEKAQIKMIMDGKGLSGDDRENVVQRLKDEVERLNEKGVKNNLEILKLREDNKLVYTKLQEFRKKYNELVNSKASLQEQLLKSEEEKLRISKALVDLQIENNDLVERSEADK